MGDAEPLLSGIFGTSRCGSTWLGSIIAAHPDVAYRFEPFHRRKKEPEILALRRAIESGDTGPDVLDRVYEQLLRSHPLTEKPPFFRKNLRARCKRGQQMLWPLARKFRAARPVFRWLYTPKGRPRVVFKEVNLETLMVRLAVDAGIPVLYLVRHPAAVVWSHLKGQQENLMGDTREKEFARRVGSVSPELLERFGNRIDDMTKPEKRALLWRVSVEQARKGLEDASAGCWIFYEDLCRDPEGESRKALAFLGLDFDDQVAAFVEASTTPSSSSRWQREERFTKSYFSVFRDPAESMNHWRREMPDDVREQVLAIVRDSPVYAEGMERGTWS